MAALALPRAKKKSLRSVKSVVPISRQEYILGLRQEAADPYLSYLPRSSVVEQDRVAC